MIDTGTLVIDRERYRVTVEGRAIHLTYMEFTALWTIVEQAGRVVTYEQLSAALWGDTLPAASRRLAVVISRVRAKLGRAADRIDTVRRVGYRLANDSSGASLSSSRERDAVPTSMKR